MIKIRITNDDATGGTLWVDDERLPNSSASWDYQNSGIQARIYDPWEVLAITKYSINDLVPHFSNVQLTLENPWKELRVMAELTIDHDPQNVTARLVFLSDAERWAGPFSLAEFRNAVREAVFESQIPDVFFEDGESSRWYWPTNTFGISVVISDLNSRLQDELERWVAIVQPILEHTRAVLSAEVQRNTLVTLFNFPAATRTICEQYLLYFIQFLRDLGIEAEGDVRHRAGQVLFSVTPEEGAEALDRIREALDIYLQIPGTPDLDQAFADARDIAALQLQANVHHLRGQLTLATAVLQARDAEIEALRISNYQYRQIIAATSEVNQIASLPVNGQDKVTDEEPLLEGIISVTPYEGKGFKVNLPAMLRSLKRRRNSSQD